MASKQLQQAATGVQEYLDVISGYDREFKKWESRVDKLLKKYRDDRTGGRSGGDLARFNILWSNVNTLVPATFSRLPQPDVSRRFRDQDPVGRVAALIVERALEFEIQHYSDYRSTLKQCIYDRFLGGRGTAWVRYEPHFRAAEQGMPTDGAEVTEDVDKPSEELDYECAPTDYVHWRDFFHNVARTWEEVYIVGRRVYMTREALIERFGEEKGKKVPLDSRPEELKKTALSVEDEKASRALILEVWDKRSKKALWIAKSTGQIVDERDDPLGLEEFFPCPRPLFATLTNESLVPTPDYALYQDQANELDTLSDRIDGLVKALKVTGVYDASMGSELQRLFTEGENGNLLPVKNWNAFAEKQGLKGSIDIVDLTPIAGALREAYAAREQIKAQIYEITGISDIVRGQTAASETATAQQIKGQYASLRLRSMQMDVAEFATELLRLKAQVMCAKFSPETLAKMAAVDQLAPADQQYVPQAIQLVAGQNPMRAFRIEIAADTLVQIDEQAEKEARVEFLTAVGTFMEKAQQVVMVAPVMTPLVMDLLKFGVQGFKVGKTVEGSFDETTEKLKQAAANPAPPPPDPKVALMQQQHQEQMQQSEQQHVQKMQQSEQQHRQKMELEERKAAMQAQEQQRQFAMQVEQQDRQFQQKTAQDSMHFERQSQQAEQQHRQSIEAANPGLPEAVKQIEEIGQQIAQRGEQLELVLENVTQQVQAMAKQIAAPRRLVKDQMGRTTHVQVGDQVRPVEFGPDGRPIGLQ